jgi:hypothetical protein
MTDANAASPPDDLLELAEEKCVAMVHHLSEAGATGVALHILAAFLGGLVDGANDAHGSKGQKTQLLADLERLRPLPHARGYAMQRDFSLGAKAGLS